MENNNLLSYITIIGGIICFVLNIFATPSRLITGMWIVIAIIWVVNGLISSRKGANKK